MTPDEHYREAERLLKNAADTYSRRREDCDLDAQRAIGHALLANCGQNGEYDRKLNQ